MKNVDSRHIIHLRPHSKYEGENIFRFYNGSNKLSPPPTSLFIFV